MEREKTTAIIGIGNCGNQVAYLAARKYGSLFDCVYINTSDSDLSMVDGPIKIKIGRKEDAEGTGKNRNAVKEYLLGDIEEILRNREFEHTIGTKEYVYIVVSAAGGTGSGAGPSLLEVFRRCHGDTHFILIGVLPQIQASSLEQGNAIEFLDELYNELGADRTTYMIYDNETVAGRSPTEGLELVNECIVEDIRVLTGVDNHPTPYDSIDSADLHSIITAPGRLLVVRVKKDLTEKILEDRPIDDIIIQGIKRSCAAETDRGGGSLKWGIVTFFTKEVNKLYTSKLEKLAEFIGVPEERFNHNAINNNNEQLNFLYLMASGLTPINDRKKKINERIEELKKAKDFQTAKNIVESTPDAYGILDNKRKERNRKKRPTETVDPIDIISGFLKK